MTKPFKKHLRLVALILCALATSPQQAGFAQRRTAPEKAGRGQPKLVLVIVVDQFRYDYLERFADLFGNGGFRRLSSEGAAFTDANYEYVPTSTAPGHAAIFSGSVPAQNGIAGNAYYDRKTGRVRAIVADDAVHLVTGKGVQAAGGAPSPRMLVGTTIGDQMRLATNFASKVVGISLKDRAAVLPAGQRPNGAFWFSAAGGEFVSSDYYSQQLPDWVRTFNVTHRPDKYFGAKWDRVLPAEAYKRAQSENLEVQHSALGRQLPYTVTGGIDSPGGRFYSAFEITPFASDYLEQFAEAALEAESLGADAFPDLLTVSFSSPDLCGHYYGPDSQEVEDTYIRLDRTIARLLDFIDKRVGLADTLIAVSADHGVAPVPEYMREKGLDAMRLSPGSVVEAANNAIDERFGIQKAVVAFTNEQLYIDQKQIAEKRLDAAEVEKVAGEAALTTPGVTAYFTRSQILSGQVPPGPIGRRVTNGFNRERSGDVFIITRPFSFFDEGALAATHGSPYNYDSHVPIILFGRGVRPGRYNSAASPSDIGVTIAVMLGVEPPSNRVGRVLTEAIADPGRP